MRRCRQSAHAAALCSCTPACLRVWLKPDPTTRSVPTMVWRQCPTYYPTSIAAGINLFLGVSCDNEEEQFSRLAGRAMSTVDAATPGVGGTGTGRLAPAGRGRRLGRRSGEAPDAEGRRQGHVPDAHRPLLCRRRAWPVRERHLPGLLRQRRRHRLRHLPGRGALLARADRQRLLDAARADRADRREAHVPVDRGRSDGALPVASIRRDAQPHATVLRARGDEAGSPRAGEAPDCVDATIRRVLGRDW